MVADAPFTTAALAASMLQEQNASLPRATSPSALAVNVPAFAASYLPATAWLADSATLPERTLSPFQMLSLMLRAIMVRTNELFLNHYFAY